MMAPTHHCASLAGLVALLLSLVLLPAAAIFQLPSYCQFPPSTRYLLVTFTSASECIRFTQYSNVLVTGGTLLSNCSIASACYSTPAPLFSTNFSGTGVLSVVVSSSSAQVTFGSASDCGYAVNTSAALLSGITPTCSPAGLLTLTVPSSQNNVFFAVLRQPSSMGLLDLVGA
jgi:hypothetical protein